MKKLILPIVLVIVVLSIVFITNNKSNAVSVIPKKSKEVELREFLKQAGFNKVPSVVTNTVTSEKLYWQKTYGLNFLTHAEVKILCDSNNFIIGPASAYQEEIPMESIMEMKRNYERITPDILKYRISTYLETPMQVFLFSESEVSEGISRRWKWLYSEIELGNDAEISKNLSGKGHDVFNTHYAGSQDYSKWEKAFTTEFSKIKIIADHRKFDKTGLVIIGNELQRPPVPDPIAVIQHRNGYIILAKWL
jgi:hypothetical protein